MKTTLRNLLIALATLSLVFAVACKDDKKKDDDDDRSNSRAESEIDKEKDDDDDRSNSRAESEIEDNLDKIVKGAAFYYTKPYINMDGQKMPCQFPATNEWTPSGDPCSSGGKFTVDPMAWVPLTWSALTFQINDDHYGQYRAESSGVLNEATMTISGRYKSCKSGKWTTFSRTVKGDPQANFVECAMQPPGKLKRSE